VAASGIVERSGQPITFTRFLAIGAPVTLVSLTIASVYLLLFQL
jgi:Na+/H+ antiporter NhaD/arsenite permease-like protein